MAKHHRGQCACEQCLAAVGVCTISGGLGGSYRAPTAGHRVAECSANPEQAKDFFTAMFWPVPEDRMLHEADCHAYMIDVADSLRASALKEDAATLDSVHQSGEH